MADAEAPEAPTRETPSRSTGKGIGSKLSRKLGPLPVWGWAVVGTALVGVIGYRIYKSRQGASASTAATPAVGADTSSTDTGMGSSGGGGGYDGGGSGQLATLLQTLQGQLASGGGAVGSQPGYSLLATVGAVKAAVASGLPLYEQSSPGVFTKYTGGVPGGNLPSSTLLSTTQATPLYTLANGAVQSSIPQGTPAGVSGAAAPTTSTSSPLEPVGPGGSPAGTVAATTPSPAVAPVTSGPSSTGTAFGGPPAAGVGGGTGPLPASGPLV